MVLAEDAEPRCHPRWGSRHGGEGVVVSVTGEEEDWGGGCPGFFVVSPPPREPSGRDAGFFGRLTSCGLSTSSLLWPRRGDCAGGCTNNSPGPVTPKGISAEGCAPETGSGGGGVIVSPPRRGWRGSAAVLVPQCHRWHPRCCTKTAPGTGASVRGVFGFLGVPVGRGGSSGGTTDTSPRFTGTAVFVRVTSHLGCGTVRGGVGGGQQLKI